ncbi:MAG: hypothetical protein RRY29_08515 [Desulfovibrionaceae bacterium]
MKKNTIKITYLAVDYGLIEYARNNPTSPESLQKATNVINQLPHSRKKQTKGFLMGLAVMISSYCNAGSNV